MQDIDFGRLYNKKKIKKSYNNEYRSPLHGEHDNNNRSPLFRTSTFLVFLVLFAFTIGLASGVYIRESKANNISYNTSSKNIIEDPLNLTGQKSIKSEEFVSGNVGSSKNDTDYGDAFEAAQRNSESTTFDLQENGGEIDNPSDSVIDEVVSDKASYLIWAKTYETKEDAYRYGLALKKKGLPVFLARNGSKLKIYVGPITGKDEAYQMLSKVKSFPTFQGAILHKKTP